MYRKLNKKRFFQQIAVASSIAVLSSCSWFFSSEFDNDGGGGNFSVDFSNGGLAIGTVVAANGRKALKPFERWRYADQLASHVLLANPDLEGKVEGRRKEEYFRAADTFRGKA